MKVRINLKKHKDLEAHIRSELNEENGKRRLTSVELKKHELILTFDDNKEEGVKSRVKKFLKVRNNEKIPELSKRYSKVEEAINEEMSYYERYLLQFRGFKVLTVVETKGYWLVFWTN